MAKKDVNQNQYINNVSNQSPGLPATNNSGVLGSAQIPNAGFVQYPQAVQNKINAASPTPNAVNTQNPVQAPIQGAPVQQNPVQTAQMPQQQSAQPTTADKALLGKNQKNIMVTFDFNKTPVTQIADYLIIQASKRRASDIHFDPREDGMMVRFRVDGDLVDYSFIPKAYQRNLTTRLKLLANMNITESRLPQDGAIKGNYGGKDLDMRVSSLPLNEGEKIVIRILDYSRSNEGIDSLGFNKPNLIKLKRMMGIPNGIILVTGATGSGKSTTTYSVLQALNKPETNIITVEDPIEMNIEGVNQVQVNSEIGMTFAAALRSILRQDPNIILIGEIRDSETAQIAVRSAITGHLVLSTIHTNNSLSTIERLLDMDVERYLLSTAMVGIISQRLAKMLCPECRKKRETSPYEKKVFKMFLNEDVDEIWDATPEGCPNCNKGYKGRIAIQEVLEFDDELRSALNTNDITKAALSKMVYNGKTITLLQDGLGKVLDGSTSFEEIYRVIEIDTGDDADETYGQNVSNSDLIKEMKQEIKENADKEEDDKDSEDKDDKKEEKVEEKTEDKVENKEENKEESKEESKEDDKKETSDDKKEDKASEEDKKEDKTSDDTTELKADEVIVKPEAIVDATKDVVIEKVPKEDEIDKPKVITDDKDEVKSEDKVEEKVEEKTEDKVENKDDSKDENKENIKEESKEEAKIEIDEVKKEEKESEDDKKDVKSSIVLSVPFFEIKDDDKEEKDNVIDFDNIPVIQSTSDVLNSSIRSGASNVTTLANTSSTPRRSDKDLLKTGTFSSNGTVAINSDIPKVKIGKEDKTSEEDKKDDNSSMIDIPSILRQ